MTNLTSPSKEQLGYAAQFAAKHGGKCFTYLPGGYASFDDGCVYDAEDPRSPRWKRPVWEVNATGAVIEPVGDLL